MTVFYNRTKTLRNAPIGTIIFWGGNSSLGTATSAVPHGWILCNGETLSAKRYPLLASIIGNTYGPEANSIKNNFPDYTDDDLFQVPNLSDRALIDHEASYLNQTTYQYNQTDASTVVGNLISTNGTSVTPPAVYSADGDLEFTMQSSNTLAGVINQFGGQSGPSLNPPTWSKTYYVIGRKLGIDHTPPHAHKGKYSSAAVDGRWVEVFIAPGVQLDSGKWTSANLKGYGSDTPDAWAGGYGKISYFDANSLVLTDGTTGKGKNDFYGNYTTVGDYGITSGQSMSYETIPPVGIKRTIPAVGFNTPAFTDTYNYGHQMKAIYGTAAGGDGVFPPPNTFFNRRNYLNSDKTTTYPTTLSHSTESPTESGWAAHNHFTFDVTMNLSTLRMPTNIPISNMQTYNVQPINIEGAVNILAEVTTANQTILTIIRAY